MDIWGSASLLFPEYEGLQTGDLCYGRRGHLRDFQAL
jgi:hypothetical protein